VDATPVLSYSIFVNILLTGFMPWGDQRVNPSGEVALALGGHVLPVDFDRAARELRQLIRRHRPRGILMTGLAAGRKRISLEAAALNVDHHEEKGLPMRWRRPIRKKGPLALAARLPLDKILQRLKAARIPAAISHHAGTFVCNHVFYVGLAATEVPCGFVHLPPFKALSRARQLRAIRTILEAIGDSSRAATR
jgi:pyroglutamyl-peptidase